MLIGVGVDVEDIRRWEDALREGKSMHRRGFSDDEVAYCQGTDRPAASFAGRWCAKEACIKAVWPVLQLTVRDVEVGQTRDGRPSITLRDHSDDELPLLKVSISHSNDHAVAVVIAMEDMTSDPRFFSGPTA